MKHYFQEHPIKVISEALLIEIICSKDATGKVAKCAINLAMHGIDYEKRKTIKSQVLADFIINWTETEHVRHLPILAYTGSCTSAAPKDTGDLEPESSSHLPREAGSSMYCQSTLWRPTS